MHHTPSFQWKDNTLYDGDVAIACFQHDPEGRGHIQLADIRLTPGGKPLIRCDLSWRYSRFGTSKLESLDVRNEGPEQLCFAFKASTPDNGYTSETTIDVSFDVQRQCYRYETVSSLRVNNFPFYSWKEIDSTKFNEYFNTFPREFANFLPLESYNYWAPVLPMRKRWQFLVYQNSVGGWNRVPQHHLLTPDKYNLRFPAGRCKVGFVDDPDGNPCIELFERIPTESQGAICWCMNDLHLLVDTVPINRYHSVRYALYQFSSEETADIQKQAKGYDYTEENRVIYDLPRFTTDTTCDFETGFDLDQPDDTFQFWLPMGEIRYTSWVHGEGRSDSRCLKNDTPKPARILWQVESSNAPVVPAGRRYKISVWVKTCDLEGEAYIEAWDWQGDRVPVPFRSKPVSGTANWQKVSVDIDIAPRDLLPGKISIRLTHEGQGVSWFDDVSIHDIGTVDE